MSSKLQKVVWETEQWEKLDALLQTLNEFTSGWGTPEEMAEVIAMQEQLRGSRVPA